MGIIPLNKIEVTIIDNNSFETIINDYFEYLPRKGEIIVFRFGEDGDKVATVRVAEICHSMDLRIDKHNVTIYVDRI